MTSRAVVLAWLFAAALVVGIVACVLAEAGPPPPEFRGAQIAVIGSSLIRNAVPKHSDHRDGLLGEGRSHWRVGVSVIDEEGTEFLLSRALDEHAQIVLIEANALLFDFARDGANKVCRQPAEALRQHAKRLQLIATDAYERLVGGAVEYDEDRAPSDFVQASIRKPAKSRGIYPLVLRGPCHPEALAQLALRAHAEGTHVVLILPPHSVTSQRLLGPIQQREVDARAVALAGALAARLFAPRGPWPDAEFVDQEHLNRRGREHFVAVLREWWRQNR